MPIKPEQVLSYLDIDPSKYEDEETFKADFNKAWVKTELAAKDPAIHGRALAGMNGKLRSRAKKAIKELELEGVEVTDETDVAELLESFPGLVSSKYKTVIDGYEAKLKDKTGDKAAKELEIKYGELHKKYEETAGLLKQSAEKYNALETGVKTEKLNARKDAYWNQEVGKVKFKQGLSDFEKEGFLSKMKSDLQILVDEEDNLYTADKEGKRIPDKARAQTFREAGDILIEKAKEYKLDASNPHGGNPLNRPISNGRSRVEDQIEQSSAKPLRKLHGGFAALMNK